MWARRLYNRQALRHSGALFVAERRGSISSLPPEQFANVLESSAGNERQLTAASWGAPRPPERPEDHRTGCAGQVPANTFTNLHAGAHVLSELHGSGCRIARMDFVAVELEHFGLSRALRPDRLVVDGQHMSGADLMEH